MIALFKKCGGTSMSTKGIYTSLSGAIAQSQRLDTIANNLANVNTPAFKKDQQIFREYLTANERPPNVLQVPKVPASIESFYDMQGGDKSYVDSAGTYTNFDQGGLKQTGNKLDFAIDGKAFFEVATPAGTRLSRGGQFTVDGNGQLVTKEGYPVLMQGADNLGANGADVAQRVIQLSGGNISVSENGQIFENNEPIAQLSLVEVADLDTLSKQGNGLYQFKQNSNPQVTNSATAKIHQGYVEASNVNIVQEMTDMISATRVFESLQKGISAYDQMNEKLVNQVGKV